MIRAITLPHSWGRGRVWWPAVWLAAWAALLLAGPAVAAPKFPPLTGRVVDAAHVLDAATVEAITARSKALEDATGRQMVVATVSSLEGLDVQEYGYQLGRAWKIGEQGKNTGVVLLVAPSEKKVGIETGYGLEGELTDALSSVILQQKVLPKFRQGDVNGGVRAGADAIADQLGLPEDEARARVAAASTQQSTQRPYHHSRSGGVPGIVGFIILAVVLSSIFGGRRRRYGYGGGGVGSWLPWVILGAMSSRGGRDDDWGGGGGGWGGGGGDGGGFSGGGGSFGGGGASGSW